MKRNHLFIVSEDIPIVKKRKITKKAKKSKAKSNPFYFKNVFLEHTPVLVSLDVSVSSSCMIVCNPYEKTIQIHTWQQRKKIPPGAFHSFVSDFSLLDFGTFSISLIIHPASKKSFFSENTLKEERYHKIVKPILECLSTLEKYPMYIAFEGHAFQTNESQAKQKLYELGGILRYELWKLKLSYKEIPPKTIKMIFSTEGGSADKQAMANRFITTVPFHEQIIKLTLGYSMENFNKLKKIPHPVEDIVDGWALLVVLLTRYF